MNTITQQPCVRRYHRRGSVTILIVIVLAMMTILGMAYMETARAQRKAVGEMSRSNVKLVADSVVSYIQDVLKNDIFHPKAGGLAFLEATATEPLGTEYYDRPMSRTTANYPIVFSDGTTGTAIGGKWDDTWLASTVPNDAATIWPHLSDLNGIWVHIPEQGNTAATKVPAEAAVSAATVNDVTLAAMAAAPAANYEPLGTDADGDGIVDSIWTWAPIRRIGNTDYVMAIRIIDNSSLLNLGVATSLINSSGGYSTGDDEPRMWNPADLDLGGFVLDWTIKSSGGVTGATAAVELGNFLDWRFGDDTLPSPWPATATPNRYDFWLGDATNGGGSYYGEFPVGSAYVSLFSAANELELRYRNGLNNATYTAPWEATGTGFPTFLRGTTAKPERRFDDVWTVPPPTTPPAHAITTPAQYFARNARLMVTTISGAAVYAPRLPGEATVLPLKVPLSPLSDVDPDVVSAEILDIISHGSFTVPAHLTSLQQYADQFAANIIDYADMDNFITAVGGTGAEMFGMEALPFLTEVYVQRPWRIEMISGFSNNWEVSMTATSSDTPGYAIEIYNPFPKAILLTDVVLQVDGAAWGELSTLTGMTTLAPRARVVLYRNSSTSWANNNPGDDNIENMIDTSDPTRPTTKVAITEDWPMTNSSPGDVDIELFASDSTGTVLTWPYCRLTASELENAPPVYNVNPYAKAGDPTDDAAYSYYRAVTSDNTWNAIFSPPVDDGRVVNGASPVTAESNRRPPSGYVTLGSEKNGPLPAAGDVLDWDRTQILVRDGGSIHQIGELANILAIGPSDTNTFPEVWAGTPSYPTPSATPTETFESIPGMYLDFSATAPLLSNDPNFPTLNRPHAAIMLSRFAAFSPANDSKDNDRIDGDDNATELFVPGVLNLNSAPEALMKSVIPIPQPSNTGAISEVRTHVAMDVVALRETASAFADLSYIGDLMEPLDHLVTVPYATLDTTTLNDGSNDIQIDFDSNDPVTGLDGIIDDREEHAMPMRWLSGIGDVRSDVFTAYVYIRGYPAEDWRRGPVESHRFMAIFFRGDMHPTDATRQTVKVLAVAPVE